VPPVGDVRNLAAGFGAEVGIGTTRTHTVITPRGNFNFSQQDVSLLEPNETLHSTFGPNGLKEFCHSNDELCP
jgi:hypothetical protein